MRVKVILIFVLFFSVNVLSQTVCINDLELKDSVLYYKGTIYTGNYECFDNAGKLRARGFIKYGKLDSITNYYASSGKLLEQVFFKNSIEQYRRIFKKTLFSNLAITLKDNIEHGLWESYFFNGSIKERRHYDNGNPIGVWTIWDKKGFVLVETSYDTDPIIEKTHQYNKNSHSVLIKYVDKKTYKVLKTEEKQIE